MTRTRIALLSASLALLLTRPVAADLVLSFDEATYTIPGVGDTTAVQVLLSQNDNGTQVGVGNELISAAIELSFATAGSATVVAAGDVTVGPAWDGGGPPVFSTSGGDTLVDLGMTSLAGISDLSSPLLLATFVFTGQSAGTTSISVATLGPGPSFITINGDELDPLNGAGARITVGTQPPPVPEPSTMVIASVATLLTAAGAYRRRARS